jgi:hypothetical protein
MGKPSSAFWPWVIAAGAMLFGLAMLDGSCRADRKYRDAKADAAEAARIDAADDARRDVLEREKDAIITRQDEIIAESVVKSAQYVLEMSAYEAELSRLREAEPVQPELEREPLVINLRAQIATLTIAFDLSQKAVAEKDVQLLAWPVKFNALQAIADARLTTIETKDNRIGDLEKALRVGERRVGLNKTVAKVALGVGAASLIYGLLK